VAVLVVLTPSAAQADDGSYIDAIMAQVADDNVYVEEGVLYADSNTEAGLAARLNSNDNLVLVALSDDSSINADPAEFVRDLGEELASNDDTVVLGVTIGTEAYTYSNYIPALTVSDMMHRSETVATNPTEVLGTYVGYVHKWQIDNPAPTPGITTDGDFNPLFGIVIPIGVGVTMGTLVYRFFRRRRQYEGIRIGVIPRPLRTQITRIMDLRQKVHSQGVQDQLRQIATDVSYYFMHHRRNTQAVTSQLTNDMEHVITALDGYILVQDGDRYFPNGREHMEQTERAIKAVAAQALRLAQNGAYDQLGRSFGAIELIQLNDPSSLFD
jgi:hypothetical protein